MKIEIYKCEFLNVVYMITNNSKCFLFRKDIQDWVPVSTDPDSIRNFVLIEVIEL